MVINHVVLTVIFGVFVLNSVTVTGWSLGFLKFAFGASGVLGTPGPLAGLLFTLSLFVVSDGVLFVAHWLHHKTPILWEFHKVHHSAEVLTPLTVLRTHPVEILINALVASAALGGMNAIFLYLHTSAVAGMTVIGANVFGFLFYLIGYHLRHSHIWIMFPKYIRNHISSPALHHIHHSKKPEHQQASANAPTWQMPAFYPTAIRECMNTRKST